MVDWNKDIPHIELLFPLAHFGVVVLHLGVICIVECDKTNIVD